MQSWGTQSRFKVRDAGTEPSKSGVVGLICAALGRPRTEPADDLALLRMGVRVDLPGAVMRDYHTAGGTHRAGDEYGVAKADGSPPGTVESWRYYLSDADFLVGLEGDLELLRTIEAAIQEPVYPLYLGRKAFVPGVPVHLADGLREDAQLQEALASLPWPQAGRPVPRAGRRPESLLLILESEPGWGQEARRDQPEGAAFLTRRFAVRYVTTKHLELGKDIPVRED
jgi:CRISPR system Cascade subunit CasD